jgi:predicted transcriptional regulator
MVQIKKPKEQDKQLRENEKKWSKTLMESGFTVFPSVILERQKALGLTPLEVNILLFLCTFWWTKDGRPRPAIGTIAEAVGRSPRHVTRIITGLVDAGLIERHQRSYKETGNLTNEYSFDGLIHEVMPFAKEKIEDRETKIAEKKAKTAKKGKPKLRVVKDTD